MKIVIVEDEIRIREGIVKLLGKIGDEYLVVGQAPDGKVGLEMCISESPDLIITDIRMPEMDGIEAFKAIRADKTLKSTNSKIVVLTANTVSGAAEMYKEVGFDYYMKKPVDVNELNRVLMSFIPEELIER